MRPIVVSKVHLEYDKKAVNLQGDVIHGKKRCKGKEKLAECGPFPLVSQKNQVIW